MSRATRTDEAKAKIAETLEANRSRIDVSHGKIEIVVTERGGISVRLVDSLPPPPGNGPQQIGADPATAGLTRG